MYIKAFLKDCEGNIHTVEVKNDNRILQPKSCWEQLQFAFATNQLVLSFIRKFRKYANKNYSLIEVHTDNALVGKQLMDNGYNVIFDPYPEEEMTKANEA